jgi:hypothetical protein
MKKTTILGKSIGVLRFFMVIGVTTQRASGLCGQNMCVDRAEPVNHSGQSAAKIWAPRSPLTLRQEKRRLAS